MTAFSSHVRYTLQQTISAMETSYSELQQLTLTTDEFLALLAPPEHWSILKHAAEVADVRATGGYHAAERRLRIQELGMSRVPINFYLDPHNGKTPLMPRNTIVCADAPPELLQRLDQWIAPTLTVKYEWALARELLGWFDVNCVSPRQVRYLWPGIVTLCSQSESLKGLGHSLRDVPPPKNVPAIPAGVRDACRRTAQLVAMASLIDTAAVETALAPQVSVTVGACRHGIPVRDLGAVYI